MRALGLRSLLLLVLLAVGPAALAQAPAEPAATPPRPSQPALPPLPPDITTQHTLELPGRTLHFSATAGAIHLTDDKGGPRADIAYVAYRLDGADPASRKVTFVLNGGPGFASAWLQVGAVGPWRIPLGGEATEPSASPEPVPNAETWLDFTDLVFIDPADTGYSRILAGGEDVRRRMFSVGGDVAYLAETIRLWLDRFNRSVSPKYILGESYGGLRAPRLARELASSQGVGVSGLVLLSPALDLTARSAAFDPFYFAFRLPSMAAAARAAQGPVTRAELADVEHYAETDFLLDAVQGERDPAAVDRRSARVAAFTGLDPAVVQQHHGLISAPVFLRERNRAGGRVGSMYDATISSYDPWPQATESTHPDPVLDGLKAPVGSAMVTIYQTQLRWHPDWAYRLESPAAFREWDWGHGMNNQTQSMSALRTALALDPHLHVLIAHGLFDLVTPYFATELLLDQLPEKGIGERVRLVAYPAGHMFYTDDASRAAFRDEGRKMFEAE